jgi:hypothetical protein
MMPANIATIEMVSQSAVLPRFKLNNCRIRIPRPIIPVTTASFWPVFNALGGSPARDILLSKLPIVGVVCVVI